MNSDKLLQTPLSRRALGTVALGATGAAALGRRRVSLAQDREKVTLWGDWTGEGETQIRTMVDAFNAAQAEYEVEYVTQEDIVTKFITGATSGQAPDILMWDRWRTALYAPRGVFTELDERIAADGINKDDFYAEAVRELSWNNKVYGLPLTVDARALFYNNAHLTEAGLQPPTTWDELAAAATALTQRDGDTLVRAGLSLTDVGLFSMYIRQAGGLMLTEDGSKTAFDSPEGLSVLTYWQSLMDAGVYEVGFESGLGEGTDAFVTGKVSMLYTGPWMLATYRRYGEELDFGVAPPVAGPNGGTGAVMGGFGLVIPSGAKQPDGGWAFLKWWLADPANAAMWGETSRNIPGNRIAAQEPAFAGDPAIKPVLDTLEYATIRPPVAGYSPMEGDALIPNLQLFMEGSQSAEESLSKAREDGDRILEENNV